MRKEICLWCIRKHTSRSPNSNRMYEGGDVTEEHLKWLLESDWKRGYVFCSKGMQHKDLSKTPSGCPFKKEHK